METISENHQDRLESEGGACIMYTPNTETLVAEYLSEHVHSWMYLD